jgi:hypothetical protein
MGFSSKQEFLQEQPFQPCQIVCLEDATGCLYAEVIQIVEARQICWVRPLLLTLKASNIDYWEENKPHSWYDLRSGSDLFYPLALFRAALDTEILPLLSALYASDTGSGGEPVDQTGHHQLRQFIQSVWQSYPDAFGALSA